MNVYIDKHTEIQKYAVTDRCTVRYMNKENRQTDSKTDRQTDRHADRQKSRDRSDSIGKK